MALAPLGSQDAKSLGWTSLLVQTVAELFFASDGIIRKAVGR
jgi:hypothetical protein